MILVTGGTGFVGSFLLRQLVERGEHIRAIRRTNSSWSLVEDIKDQIEWVEADLLDVPSLEKAFGTPPLRAGVSQQSWDGVKQVYHCGAIVSYLRKEVREMMRVNVEGTANLVNLSLAHKAQRLCHVSSIAALGRTAPDETITEEAEWQKNRYNTPYALSKHRAEREVWRGIAEGLDAVIVNPSVVLGPGQWGKGTGRMFTMIRSGFRFYPTNATGFVDVRDVAACMIRLMNSEISAERFIINAENRPMKDVFHLIAEALGKKPPHLKATPLVVELSLVFEWLRSLTGKYPRYTRALARNASTRYEFDNSKIREAIGCEFRSLEKTVEWVGAQFTDGL